jgi:hypothetical protein
MKIGIFYDSQMYSNFQPFFFFLFFFSLAGFYHYKIIKPGALPCHKASREIDKIIQKETRNNPISKKKKYASQVPSRMLC